MESTIAKQEPEWKSLEKKLRDGWPLEEASVAVGIPLEEARKHVAEHMSHKDSVDIQLRLMAQSAIRESFEKLKEIMKAAPRTSYPDVQNQNTDLDAAKTLAKLGLDALKLCKTNVSQDGNKGSGGQRDLFDLQGVYGFWKLKDPNQI